MTTPYSFETAYQQWARIPVDEFAYLDANELLTLHPLQLKELVGLAESIRWAPNGWRNKDNTLHSFLQPERWRGKAVMDFGTGLGFDALMLARVGAGVCPADMHPLNLFAVQRIICQLTGYLPLKLCLVSPYQPHFFPPQLDLFWSFGCLHHFPYADQILRRAIASLNPMGECRIVVHSDVMWQQEMQEPAPTGPVQEHPRYQEWVRKLDPVGFHCDFYTEDKIKELVKDFAEVAEYRPVGDGRMVGAVLKPKLK